jgi:hypothetical protein
MAAFAIEVTRNPRHIALAFFLFAQTTVIDCHATNDPAPLSAAISHFLVVMEDGYSQTPNPNNIRAIHKSLSFVGRQHWFVMSKQQNQRMGIFIRSKSEKFRAFDGPVSFVRSPRARPFTT